MPSSKKSRILIDIGMPLVKKNGDRFDFREHENTPGPELVKEKVLPDIGGVYITIRVNLGRSQDAVVDYTDAGHIH